MRCTSLSIVKNMDKGNILMLRRYQLHPASAPTRYKKTYAQNHEKKIETRHGDEALSQQQHSKHQLRQNPDYKIDYLKATSLRKTQCTNIIVARSISVKEIRLVIL
jgi:hypothetical protein